MVPDPYKILGLSHEASQQEIKTKYRKLAMKLHPDRLTRIGSTQEEIDVASSKFAAITAAYSLLSDPLRKQQYDHVYKYGGYDEEPSTSPETTPPAESRSKSPMPGQKGIGYSFTNPISYVLSNGKVKSQTVAGISFPTRGQMACGGAGGFQVSFSSGQAEESDTGSVRCKSHTVQFTKGKKYNRVETTNIHRDGRKEVIIEGDDFIERRFSTAPIRNRPNRNTRGQEKEARDDGLASTGDEVPWHDKLLKDFKEVTSNLQRCTNPSLCGEIGAR